MLYFSGMIKVEMYSCIGCWYCHLISCDHPHHIPASCRYTNNTQYYFLDRYHTVTIATALNTRLPGMRECGNILQTTKDVMLWQFNFLYYFYQVSSSKYWSTMKKLHLQLSLSCHDLHLTPNTLKNVFAVQHILKILVLLYPSPCMLMESRVEVPKTQVLKSLVFSN